MIKDEIERQRQLRTARKPISALHFKLIERNGCVVLEHDATVGAGKCFVEDSKEQKEKGANASQTDLDEKIARLEKDKIAKKLDSALAEASRLR